MKPLERELNVAIETAREAGRILLAEHDHATEATKTDGTLVTSADLKASQHIVGRLRALFPQYGMLDEETVADNSRFEREYCWVVDPLDDTRGYKDRTSDFGVIIGLMHRFQPVLGVTFRPEAQELVYAVRGQGAYVIRGEEHVPIAVSQDEDVRLLISRTRSSPELEVLMERLQSATVTKRGGSLKTIDVAQGSANLFLCPTTSTMHLWDLCGPQAILEEAGGRMTDRYGNAFDYSQRETANKEGVVASNGLVHQYGLLNL